MVQRAFAIGMSLVQLDHCPVRVPIFNLTMCKVPQVRFYFFTVFVKRLPYKTWIGCDFKIWLVAFRLIWSWVFNFWSRNKEKSWFFLFQFQFFLAFSYRNQVKDDFSSNSDIIQTKNVKKFDFAHFSGWIRSLYKKQTKVGVWHIF